MEVGYAGLLIGAAVACLIYVALAFAVKFAGTSWIDKLMPAAVIGPTVAVIGLGLARTAIGDLLTADAGGHVLVALFCGIVALFTIIASSVYGTDFMKLIPFIIGIGAGYVVATLLTITGIGCLQIVDFSIFKGLRLISVPDFVFAKGIGGLKNVDLSYLITVIVAYAPVAFVVFAEHLADHKNLSSVIEKDLLEEPGLDKTLLGDGVGSFAGAFFGGCPNTTYGESLGCITLTGNASTITATVTALMAMVIAFTDPIVVLLDSIPACVMGGCEIALYGFISCSGMRMIQKDVDLNENKNIYAVSAVLIAGIGGLTITLGSITLTSVACALILGILVNLLVAKTAKKA